MKTLTVASSMSLVALVLASAPAFAQSAQSTSAEEETLVGYHRAETTHVSGWFVAPTFATTSFASQLGYLPGLRGGIYLNQRFAVGVTVDVLATQDSHVGDHDGAQRRHLRRPVAPVHRASRTTCSTPASSRRSAAVAGATPSATARAPRPTAAAAARSWRSSRRANLELNVARHIRVATGVGYRFAVAAKGDGPSSGDLSGIVARTSVVFGSF